MTHLKSHSAESILLASRTHEPWIPPAGEHGVVRLSIGILLRNGEVATGPMLNSVLLLTNFEDIHVRGWICDTSCLANGCTDGTVEIAQRIFTEQATTNPYAMGFRCRIESLTRPGKLPAWNRFVHRLSAREAECLFLADGDIVVHHPGTL